MVVPPLLAWKPVSAGGATSARQAVEKLTTATAVIALTKRVIAGP
jgi:hypothetical protein